MANSSGNESSNFSGLEIINSFPSYSSNNGKNSNPKGLCPVCSQFRSVFYCSECIRNGAFMHSRGYCLERFAEKKLRLYKLNERKVELLKRYQTLLENKIKAESLKQDIALCSEKIQLLRKYIKHSSEDTLRVEKLIKHLKSENKNWRTTRLRYQGKIDSMETQYESLRNSLIREKVKLNEVKAHLKNCARENIKQLVSDIFTISKVQSPQSSKENLEESQCTALAEAQRTTYVQDHWEVTGTHDHEALYRIVEACIPGNGNYSAYLTWISKSRDAVQLTDKDIDERNAAYSIGAALTFTTHLVMAISFYLGTPLPKPICYSEFCGVELQEQSFLHKVAKLNANIVHLCLLQNVDPSLIKPQRTLKNLLLLLDTSVSDLGRCGPIELNQRLSRSIEDVITRDLMQIDNEDESGWVDLCKDDDIQYVPMYPFGATPETADQASQRTTAANGDLISSMATLLWRAAMGQK